MPPTQGASFPGRKGQAKSNDQGFNITIACFIAVMWYNSIELLILIFSVFKRYQGLYFWSLLLTTACGLLPYGIGAVLFYFQLTPVIWIAYAFVVFPWYFIVTGQSFVLYSRLHLVMQSRKVLRAVLWMIIVDAIILHIPITIFSYGILYTNNRVFQRVYVPYEKLELTWFSVQEFVISTLYIVASIRLLRGTLHKDSRKIMYQLVAINLVLVLMDVALICVEYLEFWTVQFTLKGMVYSMKLKLEFAVLSKLIDITHTLRQFPQTFPGSVGSSQSSEVPPPTTSPLSEMPSANPDQWSVGDDVRHICHR